MSLTRLKNNIRRYLAASASDRFRRVNSRKQLGIARHTEAVEERLLLAAVSWDGGGDLLWSNPLNWDSDQIPINGDDVSVSVSGDVTVVYDTGSTILNSLTLSENLIVGAGASLRTTDLSISSGKSLTAEGNNAEFRSSGIANLDGVDLYAKAGGALVIDSASPLSNTNGDMYWRATDAGSVLSLPNLTTVYNNGTTREWEIYIEALQGGHIDLPSVTEIIDPNSGDERGRSIKVTAERNNAGHHVPGPTGRRAADDDAQFRHSECFRNSTGSGRGRQCR